MKTLTARVPRTPKDLLTAFEEESDRLRFAVSQTRRREFLARRAAAALKLLAPDLYEIRLSRMELQVIGEIVDPGLLIEAARELSKLRSEHWSHRQAVAYRHLLRSRSTTEEFIASLEALQCPKDVPEDPG